MGRLHSNSHRKLSMREIKTHKINGVNDMIQIEAGDKLTVGGAPISYWMTLHGPSTGPIVVQGDQPVSISPTGTTAVSYDLRFQDGTIKDVGVNGVTTEALLAILIDRLECFQAGPYPCEENACALEHLRGSLSFLQRRTKDRVARGVEGKITA